MADDADVYVIDDKMEEKSFICDQMYSQTEKELIVMQL